MGVVIKSADLSVSPDAAWDVVERFMRAEVRVFGFIEENRIEGPLRTVISREGSLVQPELNITLDPEQRYASYTLLESSYWTGSFHHASMRVFDTGDGRSRFEWITDVAPDWWASEEFGGEYMDTLWAELVSVLETGKDVPATPVAAS